MTKHTHKTSSETTSEIFKTPEIPRNGNLSDITPENLCAVFRIFGLSESEQKILLATSTMSKTMSAVARHTGLSRTTVQHSIKNLEKRGMIRKSVNPILNKKNVYWRSDIKRTIRELRRLVPASQSASNPHLLNTLVPE